jgi:ATP-dependent Clp protease protease subunit
MDYINPLTISGNIRKGDFYDDFMRRFAQLMNQTEIDDDVTLFIDSGGGDTRVSLGIYDLIRACGRNVTGIVTGTAQSGASLIFQACNKRIMAEHSTLMLHSSEVSVSGSVENAQRLLDDMRRLDKVYYRIYAERTKDNVEKIANMAHRDVHFSAEGAVEIGLADEILGS